MRRIQLNILASVLCLWVLFLVPIKGQAQLLSPAYPGIPNLPDTVDMGDLISFDYEVINNGPLPLTAPLILTWMKVNGAMLSLPIDSTILPGIVPVGDTFTISIADFFVSPSNNNTHGANIVVIWPTAPGQTPKDSSSGSMYVRNPNGIEEESLAAFQLYPNPATDQIRIDFRAKQTGDYSISLISVEGRELMQRDSFILKDEDYSTAIDLTPFPSGMYFLRVRSGLAVQTRKLIIRQ